MAFHHCESCSRLISRARNEKVQLEGGAVVGSLRMAYTGRRVMPALHAAAAIYTRKSTEHNLDLAFTSLDAQREACEASREVFLAFDIIGFFRSFDSRAHGF
jgi:hypothetical protein